MPETPDLRGQIRRFGGIRRHSVTADRLAYLAATHWNHRGRVVLVYSMPKVGSATMHRAIAQCTDRPVLHFHNLTRAQLKADKRWWYEHSSDHHLLWQWRGEYARARVTVDRRSRWDVVHGVREPIARTLSHFFHQGERAGYLSRDVAPDDVDIERLRALYLDRRLWTTDWFRAEFQPGTGIDVYARRFPTDEGCAEYGNDRFRSLLVRQEDLARVGAPALNRFLGTSTIELPRWNSAERKFYQPVYERFRSEVRLPEEVIERAYSSEQARHFYTPSELDAFRARWLG